MHRTSTLKMQAEVRGLRIGLDHVRTHLALLTGKSAPRAYKSFKSFKTRRITGPTSSLYNTGSNISA